MVADLRTDIFHALCLHDFEPQSPSEIKFNRGDVLKIIQVGSSEWWCAENTTGDDCGWVPAGYVQRIPSEVAQMLKDVNDAVTLYASADEIETDGLSFNEFVLSLPRTEQPLPSLSQTSGSSSSSGKSRVGGKTKSLRPLLPKTGSIESLVRRAITVPLDESEEKAIQHILFTTFTTFTTGEDLLELLIKLFDVPKPDLLSPREYAQWKARIQTSARAGILSLLANWLDYGLVEDYPHLMPKVLAFVARVCDKSSVKIIKQRIKDARRQSTAPINTDLQLKLPQELHALGDPFFSFSELELAQQLTLYEAKLYYKIRPRDCLAWVQERRAARPRPRGFEIPNLSAFIGTSDRIASWVKYSILRENDMVRRGEIIDRWIGVAECCLGLWNLSSVFAIVAALCSAVVSRLKGTWEGVRRIGHAHALRMLISPSRNYKECRALMKSFKDGPSVPFIGMHLAELTRISEMYEDYVLVSPPSHHPTPTPKPNPDLNPNASTPTSPKLINFTKCQKNVLAIDKILKYQRMRYSFDERKEGSMLFIATMLARCGGFGGSWGGDEWFWEKGRKVLEKEEVSSGIVGVGASGGRKESVGGKVWGWYCGLSFGHRERV